MVCGEEFTVLAASSRTLALATPRRSKPRFSRAIEQLVDRPVLDQGTSAREVVGEADRADAFDGVLGSSTMTHLSGIASRAQTASPWTWPQSGVLRAEVAAHEFSWASPEFS